ncbi:MAG TPA: beta-galactosidase trimerization domain-containing protein [Thermaerobacter sp.]
MEREASPLAKPPAGAGSPVPAPAFSPAGSATGTTSRAGVPSGPAVPAMPAGRPRPAGAVRPAGAGQQARTSWTWRAGPAFLLGVNYWPSRQGVEMWRDWQPEAIAAELQALAATGCRVVRFFLRWSHFQPEEDRVDPVALGRLRQFCDLAHGAGLGVIPTFFTGHMSGENWDVPWRRGRCPYTDPGMLRAQVRLVQAVAAAIGDHPALVAWDLANEPDIFVRPPSPDAGWLWCRLLYRELKAATPTVPVTLGIHVASLVDDCGFRPEDVAEAADFLCMHLYPIYSPWCPDPVGTIRPNLLVPFGDRLVAAMGRRPALAEEFGGTTLMMAPERHGRYVNAVLGSLFLHGSLGAVAWCGLDFTCAEDLPYDSTPYEVAFGILDADGRPKPAGEAFARFARLLEKLPAPLHPLPPRAAILLPERYYDNADADITPERNFAVLFNAFVLARRAGLAVDLVRPDDDWSGYRLLIAPCVPRRNSLSNRTWNRLRRWVEAGGTLYLSYDGVALPGMEAVFGVAIQDAYPREAADPAGGAPGAGLWELVLDEHGAAGGLGIGPTPGGSGKVPGNSGPAPGGWQATGPQAAGAWQATGPQAAGAQAAGVQATGAPAAGASRIAAPAGRVVGRYRPAFTSILSPNAGTAGSGVRKRLVAQARGAAVVGWIRPALASPRAEAEQPAAPEARAAGAEPAVFVHRWGRGWAMLVTDPLEWMLAGMPGVYRDDATHQLYRLAARLAGLDGSWQVDHPDVEAGILMAPGGAARPGATDSPASPVAAPFPATTGDADGDAYLVVVSHHPAPLRVTVTTAAARSATEPATAAPATMVPAAAPPTATAPGTAAPTATAATAASATRPPTATAPATAAPATTTPATAAPPATEPALTAPAMPAAAMTAPAQDRGHPQAGSSPAAPEAAPQVASGALRAAGESPATRAGTLAARAEGETPQEPGREAKASATPLGTPASGPNEPAPTGGLTGIALVDVVTGERYVVSGERSLGHRVAGPGGPGDRDPACCSSGTGAVGAAGAVWYFGPIDLEPGGWRVFRLEGMAAP